MCALVSGLLIGLSGCKKKEVVEEQSPEATPPAATPTVATPPPATPEPKPVVVATPPPSTPAPELAPPGVFYLITSVSVETSDGILGLKPGQLLREVRTGVYRADNNEVTLRPDQVTNDMAVARRLAAQDQRNQEVIQQRLTTHSGQGTSAGTPGASGAPKAPAPTPNKKAEQDAARQELFRQRQALNDQATRLGASLNEVSSHYGSWQIAAKKSAQAFQLLQQYNALQRQIGDVDAQINQLH